MLSTIYPNLKPAEHLLYESQFPYDKRKFKSLLTDVTGSKNKSINLINFMQKHNIIESSGNNFVWRFEFDGSVDRFIEIVELICKNNRWNNDDKRLFATIVSANMGENHFSTAPIDKPIYDGVRHLLVHTNFPLSTSVFKQQIVHSKQVGKRVAQAVCSELQKDGFITRKGNTRKAVYYLNL